MGFTPATRLLIERAYLFLTPILLGIGCYLLYKQGKQIESVLILLIGWSAIFYYWIKYFKIPSMTAQTQWPPFVSTCPDYLTLVSPNVTGATTATCMDFVGISMKPSAMFKADPNNIPTVSDPNFHYYSFVVETPSSTGNDATQVLADNCAAVKARGLTWIHVCD